MDYTKFEEKHNFGDTVDKLINDRQLARMVLMKSEVGLLELGVKTFKGEVVKAMPNLDKAKYEAHNCQEFSWEAEYVDGTILKQFQGKKEHHFKHIDQDKLKYLRWVSNFVTDTSNEEKRVIATMSWEDGTFNFLNGIISQECRMAGSVAFSNNPKLIMKMVNRESSVGGFAGDEPEIMRYNRYILGWQTESMKQIMCIEPNGRVHIWHE